MRKKAIACTWGALLAAMLVPAAVATADTTDTDFTNFLTSHGINVGSTSRAVNMAHIMCQDLQSGYTQKDEVDQLTGAGHMTQQQAEQFIGAATADYCPDKHPANKPGS